MRGADEGCDAEGWSASHAPGVPALALCDFYVQVHDPREVPLRRTNQPGFGVV